MGYEPRELTYPGLEKVDGSSAGPPVSDLVEVQGVSGSDSQAGCPAH